MPKYFLQQISHTVFHLSFYLFSTVLAFELVFGNSVLLKKAFVSTDAYNKFIPAVIASAEQSGQVAGTMPLGDPEVRQIIEDSFSPRVLQTDTETVINSVYAWLNGQTEKPDYRVDFTASIQTMAHKLSVYGVSRLLLQSVCDSEPTEIDPFTANCRPQFFDYEQSQHELESAIVANNGIVSKLVYTVDDLPKTSAGKSLVEQYSYAPTIFMVLRYAPGILTATTLLSGLLVVYLSRRKRESIHRLGTEAISSGLFIAVSPLLYIYVIPKLFPSFESAQANAGVVVNAVVNKITGEFNTQLIFIGVLACLAGAAVFMLERATRPRSKYIKVSKKTGLASSEVHKLKKLATKLKRINAPIQTSEGAKKTGKYQKDKRYRRIHSKEY